MELKELKQKKRERDLESLKGQVELEELCLLGFILRLLRTKQQYHCLTQYYVLLYYLEELYFTSRERERERESNNIIV